MPFAKSIFKNNAVSIVFFAVAAMAFSASFALDIDLAKAGISVADPGNPNQAYPEMELND